MFKKTLLCTALALVGGDWVERGDRFPHDRLRS